MLVLGVLVAIVIVCAVLLVRTHNEASDELAADALREAYRAANLPEAHLVAGLMRQVGLSVTMRNADVLSAAGELPPHSVLPTLWVRGESEFGRAREVVALYEQRLGDATLANLPDWTCASCGEISPGNFELCWQCREPRETGSS
jgi:hypothetical protein